MFGGGSGGTAALRGSGPCCRGGIDAPHAGGYTNRNFGARFPAFPAQGRFLMLDLKLLQKQPEVVAAALADPKVQKFTEGKKLVKTILVPNKLVNLIAK